MILLDKFIVVEIVCLLVVRVQEYLVLDSKSSLSYTRSRL
jgi:hypothetical protein